ncbi:hypothetical protein C1I99_24015 [Micromonospora deserti]|uniref:Uncharacterized protein n=1 Tax=Micromonospora deserti TaxID=2070366 RepID=A0A2W2D0P3_9ACTN|nr:hypothetical protein C1I99_24015 [Micromonospora deserti]
MTGHRQVVARLTDGPPLRAGGSGVSGRWRCWPGELDVALPSRLIGAADRPGALVRHERH